MTVCFSCPGLTLRKCRSLSVERLCVICFSVVPRGARRGERGGDDVPPGERLPAGDRDGGRNERKTKRVDRRKPFQRPLVFYGKSKFMLLSSAL